MDGKIRVIGKKKTVEQLTSGLFGKGNKRIYEDKMTGAFNRKYFDENQYIYDLTRSLPRSIGFVVIDVNNLKYLNNKLGSSFGEIYLTKLGETLRQSFRNTDKVIRMSEDEFLVVVKDCSKSFMEKKMRTVKETIRNIKIDWFKQAIPSVSMGMSFANEFQGTSEQMQELWREADENLQEDKSRPIMDPNEKIILVVEPDQTSRGQMKRILQAENYYIFEAEDYVDAAAILKKNYVDLIVVNVSEGNLADYDFLKNVRNHSFTKEIAIIALTGTEEDAQSKAIQAGADLYVEQNNIHGSLMEKIVILTSRDYGNRELFDIDFVLDAIPGAVVVFKFMPGEFRIMYCSKGIKKVAGWESVEFCRTMEKGGERFVHPDDLTKYRDTIIKIIRTHSEGELFYRGFKKDGTEMLVWFQGRFIGKEAGCPVVQAIFLDVTNRTPCS